MGLGNKVSGQAEPDILGYIPDNAQSLLFNPAAKQPKGLTIGVPVLTGLHLRFANRYFSYKKWQNALQSNDNADNFILSLKKDERIKMSYRQELFYAAFKTERQAFWVTSGIKMNFRFDLPSSLIRWAWFGNAHPQYGVTDLNYSNSNVANALAYIYYGAGYQRSFMDEKLTLGLQLNYLQGIAGVDNAHLNFHIKADEKQLYLLGNESVDIGGLAAEDSLNSNQVWGKIGQNNGYSVNLAGSYKWSDKLQSSLIIENALGHIKWTKRRSLNGNVSYSTDGANVDFTNQQDVNGQFQDAINNTLDSLSNVGSFTDTILGGFTQRISPRIAAATTMFFGKNKRSSATLDVLYSPDDRMAQIRTTGAFSVVKPLCLIGSIDYTIGLGAVSWTGGLQVTGGPFQFYLLAQTQAFTINWFNSKSVGIDFGMSFRFGEKDSD